MLVERRLDGSLAAGDAGVDERRLAAADQQVGRHEAEVDPLPARATGGRSSRAVSSARLVAPACRARASRARASAPATRGRSAPRRGDDARAAAGDRSRSRARTAPWPRSARNVRRSSRLECAWSPADLRVELDRLVPTEPTARRRNPGVVFRVHSRSPALPASGRARGAAVALAQPAEHRIVAPKVMGSTPVGHPNTRAAAAHEPRVGATGDCAAPPTLVPSLDRRGPEGGRAGGGMHEPDVHRRSRARHLLPRSSLPDAAAAPRPRRRRHRPARRWRPPWRRRPRPPRRRARPARPASMALDTVAAGVELEVTWTGPNGAGRLRHDRHRGHDRVDQRGLLLHDGRQPGAPDRAVAAMAPTSSGTSPVRTRRSSPGGRSRSRRSRATCSGRTRSSANTEFEVAWNGPNGPGDYVTIVKAGATRWTNENYFYTTAGSPGTLLAPLEAGAYELWYVIGSDRTIQSRRPITVTAASATLDGAGRRRPGRPVRGDAGRARTARATTSRSWRPGADVSTYLSYFYTRMATRAP